MATTNKKIHFSYFERKQDFTPALQAELTNNIVFVEDTKEVYTHGEFFGIRGVTLNYDSSTAKLQLKDGGVVVSEMDASAFVKDGMLDSVELVKTQESGVSETVPYLKFVFNTDAGKSAVRLSVSDLVDSYDGSSIALTQSFAPASSYSAPAAGDSVDVAVGKLLKGHSDNVTALSQKQATITGAATTVTMNNLTPDRALASSGSGKIAVSTTTATELGYVHGVTSGIQAQIDSVSALAAKGLKQVSDMSSYTPTNGEIVEYVGVTDSNYTHGYVYEATVISTVIESGTKYITVNDTSGELLKVGISNGTYYQISDPDDPVLNNMRWYLWSVGDATTQKGYIPVYQTNVGGILGKVASVGEWALYDGSFRRVASVGNLDETGRLKIGNSLTNNSTITFDDNVTVYVHNNGKGNGEDGTNFNAFEAPNGARIYQRNNYSFIFPVEYVDGVYQVITSEWTSGITNGTTSEEQTVTSLGWQRIDVQPQTDISGKQDALTFDDAPTANSGNVVKSGGVKTAIDAAPRFYIGTCSTAGNVAIKQVDIPGFPTTLVDGVETPIVGSVIAVKFANNDAATSEQKKIKVNNTSAYPLWYDYVEPTITSSSYTLYGRANAYIFYLFNGTHWVWVNWGADNNTTYTAGSGLKLSSNKFSLNVPRVSKTANSLPGVNTAAIEEYTNGTNYNLPTNNFYHILTFEGNDNNYATQLALGMNIAAAYYRLYGNGTWYPWLRLDNPSVDSTPTASSTNPVQSGGTKTYVDEQVATKSSITIRQWVTE